MKRRDFLKSATALTALAGVGQISPQSASAQLAKADKPQYYELRIYTLKSEHQQKLVDDYWQKAAIPAYNRLGSKPIGVFTELDAPEVNKLLVLIPFDSLEAFATANASLQADAEYQTAGADYLTTAKADPAYVRFDSSLLMAFESMKKLAAPASAEGNKPWIFELRTYESHSETKGFNKIEMFNNGEVPVMQEVGLSPVFFAQTLIGPRLPNLVYMVSGEDKKAHSEHWKAFFAAPTWTKLSTDPKFKDNVSKVVSAFWKRTAYSQI